MRLASGDTVAVSRAGLVRRVGHEADSTYLAIFPGGGGGPSPAPAATRGLPLLAAQSSAVGSQVPGKVGGTPILAGRIFSRLDDFVRRPGWGALLRPEPDILAGVPNLDDDLDALTRGALAEIDAASGQRTVDERVEQAMRTILTAGIGALLRAAAPAGGGADTSPEDAVQEACTSFARRIQEAGFRYRMVTGRPFSYLFRMTRNRALDMLEADRRARRLSEEMRGVAEDPNERQRPDLRLEREEAARALIARLPEEDRELVWRVCVSGETSQEVAEAVGRTPAAVRQRVSRAMVRMRAHAAAMEERSGE